MSGGVCPSCKGSGVVCEDHPDRPWRGGDGCCGAAGMACRDGCLGITPLRRDAPAPSAASGVCPGLDWPCANPAGPDGGLCAECTAELARPCRTVNCPNPASELVVTGRHAEAAVPQPYCSACASSLEPMPGDGIFRRPIDPHVPAAR